MNQGPMSTDERSRRRLTISESKLQRLLFATSQRAQSLSNQVSVNISGVTIPLSNQVKILGVVLDRSLSLSLNIQKLYPNPVSTISVLLIKHIRDSLDSSTIRTIAAALVTSRLDYANSVLYGIPAKYISRLQRTQNTLARVVAGNRTPMVLIWLL